MSSSRSREQDRTHWDADAIRVGLELVAATLPHGPVGPYQVQAAIAAVHAEAPSAADTDWPQILSLYDLLSVLAPNPMVTLNRVVALAMVQGPRAGLDVLASLDTDEQLAGHHRIDAVRAHLLDMAGDESAARGGVPASRAQDDERSGAALPAGARRSRRAA